MTDQKAIFITGGGSGIGQAVAVHFAERGYFVGIADINMTGCAETAAMLPKGMSSIHQLDVRERDQWHKALEEFTAQTGGKLHVLFNNAGIPAGGLLGEHSEADIERVIDINFKGVVYGAQIAQPYLAATPDSCLLNTSSASGIYGTAGLCVYSATKFAVRGLTEALDVEWQSDGIRVRALMPGFINTPLVKQSVGQSNQSIEQSVIAGGMEISPVERVAEAAWAAVHEPKKVHHYVGKTARQLAFAAKWMPGALRKRMKKIADGRRETLG